MKKTQGEIFGIALLFVIIILGIIIYAQIKANNPDQNKDLIKEGKFKILAEGTINTILKQSTGCYPERNKDSVIDLIQYCLYNHNVDFDSVYLTCNDDLKHDVCTYPIEILNKTLYNMYNNSNNIHIPFYLTISLESFKNTHLSNVQITNFGDISYKGKPIKKENYLRKGFNKANSGLVSIPTSYRNIDFELALYYR